METLVFTNGPASIRLLDDIMFSYQGWGQGTVSADHTSLTCLMFLLEKGIVQVTKHTYIFDTDILTDAEITALYMELAPQTRWRRYQHTEIEAVRMNALRQMRAYGEPSYNDYVCYQDGAVEVHCGNISPNTLLMHLAEAGTAKQFYIFSYPYQREDNAAYFFRFDFSDLAIQAAQAYRERVWKQIAEYTQKVSPQVFPKLEDTE